MVNNASSGVFSCCAAGKLNLGVLTARPSPTTAGGKRTLPSTLRRYSSQTRTRPAALIQDAKAKYTGERGRGRT